MTPRRWVALLVVGLWLLPLPAWAAEQSKREQLRERYQPKNIQFNAPQGSLQVFRAQTGAAQQELLMNAGAANEGVSAAPAMEQTAPAQREGRRGRLEAVNRITVAPAPVVYAIYQTEYQAEIEEDIAFVTARVKLETFHGGGVARIPFADAQVGLKEVSLNRRPSMVNLEGNQYVVLIERPGRYDLEAQFFVKVAREREHGPGSFSFTAVPSPISLLDVHIEEPETDIFVEPSIKIEQETLPRRTLATVVLPHTNRILVRWTKAAAKVDLPSVVLEPKLYAESMSLVSVGDGILDVSSRVRYSILQREVSTLTVALPQEVAVLDVQGQHLRDWKVASEEGRQAVEVYLTRGVKGAYDLHLDYEQLIGEGSVTAQLPELVVAGVEREQGLVGIQAKTNAEIAFGRLADATEIDVKELPSELWSQAAYPILLAYKYLKHPHQVEISVKQHEEVPVLVAAVDTAQYVTLMTSEGKALTGATLIMRNNVKQFMRLRLPDGASLLSCFVSGEPVKPAQDQEWVLIPLKKSEALGETAARFPVELVYLAHGEPFGLVGRFTLRLPQLDIPTGQLDWSVYAPEEFNYWTLGGDVKPIRHRAPSGWQGPLQGFGMLRGERAQRRDLADQRAADEVGEKLPAAPAPLRQQEGQKVFSALKATKAGGALPIRIEIPTAGTVLRFSKLLVTEESPWLLNAYVRNAKGAAGALQWFVFLGVLGVGGALGRRAIGTGLPLTCVHGVLGVAVAAVALLCLWLAGLKPLVIGPALILVGLYLLGLRWRHWSRRKPTDP
jgi:hypothetical protein